MRDPEKPLKVLSGIVSGLLVVSALVFFLLASGKPKEAEAILEYSVPPGFDPSELASELGQLRKDEGILMMIALRSKQVEISNPELVLKLVSKLGNHLSLVVNPSEPTISIRFPHRNSNAAIDVTNAAAAVIKESLENLQQKRATEIRVWEDEAEDRRKLLTMVLREDAEGVPNPPWGRRQTSIEAKASYEEALRKLEELKTKPVFSPGWIHAAKVTSD